MKIGFVTHDPGMMGANRSLLNLINAARDQYGIVPFVVVPRDGDFQHCLANASIDHIVTPVPHFARPRCQNTRQASVWQKSKQRIRKMLVGGAAPDTKLISKWMDSNSVDVVHSNSSVIKIGLECAIALGLPHVWHIREFIDLDYGLEVPGGFHRLSKMTERSDKCIFISKSVYEHFGCPSNGVVITNGVATKDDMVENFSKRTDWTDKALKIGMVGYLSKTKGQDVAIRLVKQLKARGVVTALSIAGDGPEKDNLIHEASRLGVAEQVQFVGKIDQPLEFFRGMHIALTCSQMEAWGRVTAEAMSSGCIVLARNSGGTPELISNGVTGYLWRDENELLQQAIMAIDDVEQSQRVAEAAHQKAVTNFCASVYADNVFNVWESVQLAT